MALDRKYIPRYGTATFAIQVYRNGEPGAADGDAVTATMLRENDPTPIWTRAATAGAITGLYEVSLTSVDTQTPDDYHLRFEYEVDGVAQAYGYDIEVAPSAPQYEALTGNWSGVIDSVWAKLEDLFDSPYGGPNLQVYVQTNFGRNRMAQLLTSALQRLNSASSPHVSHEFNGQSFEFVKWGGLLAQSLYMEVLKHLVRSYVEQPEVILGTAVSRLDRRDYMQRWQQIYDMEQREFERDLSRYRQANMGLGNYSVLVSGGAFGNLGPFVNAGGGGAAAARGYFSVNRSH